MINPRVLSISDAKALEEEFRKIGVDRGGVPIMSAKGIFRFVKLTQIPVFWANILKQEMLSLGAEAAVSRGTLTGQVKTSDCILIASLSQYRNLFLKLKKQPFGLAGLGPQIQKILSASLSPRSLLNIGGKSFSLGKKTLVMGILNVTPDSFSGDGLLGRAGSVEDRCLALSREMVRAGADMLDIGGESTRPDARKVGVKDEMARVLPALKIIKKNRLRVPISIDTMKSEVARAALEHGASIVNDVSALRFDKKMAKLVAVHKAAVVLTHMRGTPRTMQQHPRYDDLMGEIALFLEQAIGRAREAGIPDDKIILDPGIGFGKTLEHNVEILKRLPELKSFGRPILVGVSRKRFIGNILDADVSRRDIGTAAALSLSVKCGADIVRVHNVRMAKQVVRVADVLVR